MLTSEEKAILEEQDPHWFEEFFFRDLDGWFSSDIACCDDCYDEFLEHWPHAYSADEAAFQCNSISLGCFYSGSRLQDVYTEEQFFKFLPLVPCPRCGNELKHNIWAYSFPFDVVDGFEKKISEIAEISQSTPFLLLKHPFAREVYEVIGDVAKETEPAFTNGALYRGRTIDSLKNNDLSQFGFPPNKVASEGRYNHAGMSVLYLASDLETCYFELRKAPCRVAKIQLNDQTRILDLTNPDESHNKHRNLLSTLIYSALMSARQDDIGQHKPKYVFSRFISDCAKFAGFDAIQYPSTRTVNGSYNIVILDDKISLDKTSTLIELPSYEEVQTEDI